MPPRIVLLYTDTEMYLPLEQHAQKLLEALGETDLGISPHAVWEGLQFTRPDQALSALQTWRPALVVTPASAWIDREKLLGDLLDRVECPVLISR
jgi:hypothetical protein